MPIVTQESRTALITFGDQTIDLTTFTTQQLRTVLNDIQALMKANTAMRQAGKRDVITAIRVESIYVGINRQVQTVLALQLASPVQGNAAGIEPTPPVSVQTAA